MTEANYLVEITDKDVACLGSQLVRILDTINPFIENVTWYASDIDANIEPAFFSNFKGALPKKIGNTSDLVKLCRNVPQFLSGVFLAFLKDQGEYLSNKYSTEDKEFRDIGDAILEIRAFDTSYYKIYANNFSVIEKIANEFYGIPRRNLKK